MAPEPRLKRTDEMAHLSPREDYPMSERKVSYAVALAEPVPDPATPLDGVAHPNPVESADVQPGEAVPGKVEKASGTDSFSKWAALAAVGYAGTFVGKLIWGYYAWETGGVSITWSVRDNPRTAIAASMVLAAAVLWFVRGVTGKALALVPFGLALYQFYLWRIATPQFTTGLGAENVPQLSGSGRLLHGAGPLDLLALVAVLALTAIGIGLVVKEIRRRGDERRSMHGSTIQPAPNSR